MTFKETLKNEIIKTRADFITQCLNVCPHQNKLLHRNTDKLIIKPATEGSDGEKTKERLIYMADFEVHFLLSKAHKHTGFKSLKTVNFNGKFSKLCNSPSTATISTVFSLV
jgi:hypothetical protein